jgi:deoxyribonuclease-4
LKHGHWEPRPDATAGLGYGHAPDSRRSDEAATGVNSGPETRGRTTGNEPALPRPRVRLPGARRAGAHLPIGIGLLKVADRAIAIGASTIQIFSDNPTAWQRRAAPPPDVDAFRERLRSADMGPLAIHAAYLINLAGPNDELFGLSVGLLRHELEHAHLYGAAFVNVHIGSHRGSGVEAGIRRVVDGLETAMQGLDVARDPGLLASPGKEPASVMLVLENSSGGGASIGATIEEIGAVVEAADDRGIGHGIGVCLDTAHLWGVGYDVGDPDAVDAVVARFDELIGLDRLVMMHVNDSHSERGSRQDRHSHIGEGLIGRAGLARLVSHPRLGHVACYLETPGMEHGYDLVNLARLEDMAEGRPLTPGPDGTGRAPAGRSESGRHPGRQRRPTDSDA